MRHHCPDIPIILVGTKKDLRDAQEAKRSSKESHRSSRESYKKKHLAKSNSVHSSDYTIDAESAKSLCNDLYNVVNYVECSAKTGEGVKDVFEEGIRAVVNPKVDTIVKTRKCALF